MLEIALNKSPGGVYQKDIAKNQEISVRYLDHIIAALKVAGLITTVRGKKRMRPGIKVCFTVLLGRTKSSDC